ncbi:Lrp/AsnC family transcriptional regulator [Blastococcus sp. SYSU D00820]
MSPPAAGPRRPLDVPSPSELDALDRALVRALQVDGRATYEALALQLGVSRPAVRTRLLRLTESGAVRVTGVVHPSVFGLHAYAHLGITVDGPVLPVAAALEQLPEAPFVSVVTGPFDLAVELRCADQASLAAQVHRIGCLPGVRAVDTAVYTQIVKDAYHPARPLSAVSLDDVDRQLLGLLQADGRASFASLGQSVGLSTGAARSRVLRLLDAGVVSVGARSHPSSLGMAHFSGFGLRSTSPLEDRLAELREMPEVQYLAGAIGRSDVVGTAIGETQGRLLEVLERIRALPGVHSLACWTHLSFVKESYDHAAWPAAG